MADQIPSQSASQLPPEVRSQISGLECDLRGLRHHETRATEELDKAGVEKYDDGDGQGGEWSIWVRIKRLARDRDRLAAADAGALLINRDEWRTRALAAERALVSIRQALKEVDDAG